MGKKFRLASSAMVAAALLAGGLPANVQAAPAASVENPAKATSANVPVDTDYYTYLDKLVSMGYVRTLPNGAKPYSRMQFAQWAVQAESIAKDKPMPAYLRSQLQAIEDYVAPEITALNERLQLRDGLAVRNTKLSLAVNSGEKNSAYRYRGPNATYQAFGANNNGHHYAKDGNGAVTADINGNIGQEVAVGLRPRMSYNNDSDFDVTLDEAYAKTRMGVVALEVGKQALSWGQGETGHFGLGTNMKPLTAVQLHYLEPQHFNGLLHFLGKVDSHIFYGRLDGDRKDTAAAIGRHDYNRPGLLGWRVDVTPADYFTMGFERLSMLGGNGNGLSKSDWRHWVFARNDGAAADKWDDIAGVDFRLKFPGVQLYSEIYGEDAGGITPTDRAYRWGLYLPRLTRDGSWDMTMEYATTNKAWYVHQKYQNGWDYSNRIMGDAMGQNAHKYYVAVNHYLPHESKIGLYGMRTEMDRDVSNHPTVTELGLTGQTKLENNLLLSGTLGYAKLEHPAYQKWNDHDLFAQASLEWRY